MNVYYWRFKVTGEHFSSVTGKQLVKDRDAYVRFRWEEKRRKAVATILEKAKIMEDVDLHAELEEFFGRGVKDKCLFCAGKETYPLVRFEFYNWEQPKTEEEKFAHSKCLHGEIRLKLDALRLVGKNPVFNVAITCLSVEQCPLFMKSASLTRNCEHIAFKFDVKEGSFLEEGREMKKLDFAPVLYCKRAHPGLLALPSEAELDWNVERTGLAIFLSQIEQIVDRPEFKTAWEQMKQNNPQAAELAEKFTKNPMAFALTMMGYQIVKVNPQTMEAQELEEEKKTGQQTT